MIKRLVIVFVPGVLASLLAGWLLNSWDTFSPTVRLLISGVVGGLVVLLLIFLTRQNERSGGRVASGIVARKDVRVRDVDVEDAASDKLEVASDITSEEGDVNISEVKVRRGGNSHAGNGN